MADLNPGPCEPEEPAEFVWAGGDAEVEIEVEGGAATTVGVVDCVVTGFDVLMITIDAEEYDGMEETILGGAGLGFGAW